MTFKDKFLRIVSKVKRVSNAKLWTVSILFSLFVTLLSLGYYQLSGEGAVGRRLVSQVTADAGMLLIGISFMFSGLTYFWDFVDRKIIYRKHIGLVGFYVTLAHVYVALSFTLNNPQIALGSAERVWSFIFALFALFIFILMTTISNRYAVTELGNKAWRLLLRTGYLAYLFAIIHTALRKWPIWQNWYNGEMAILPPLSLVVMIFAVFVFGLRVALWWSLRNEE